MLFKLFVYCLIFWAVYLLFECFVIFLLSDCLSLRLDLVFAGLFLFVCVCLVFG